MGVEMDHERVRHERVREEARLLRTAAAAPTLPEQRAALAALEALRTQAMREQEQARSLDLGATAILDTLVPGRTHELHTAATDWLLEIPEHTASQADAEHALIAEATLWFARVDPVVRADGPEFVEQARNKARHVASQYGVHAPHAQAAFLTEAARLHAQHARGGANQGGAAAPGLQASAALHTEAGNLADHLKQHRQQTMNIPDLDAPGHPDVEHPVGSGDDEPMSAIERTRRNLWADPAKGEEIRAKHPDLFSDDKSTQSTQPTQATQPVQPNEPNEPQPSGAEQHDEPPLGGGDQTHDEPGGEPGEVVEHPRSNEHPRLKVPDMVYDIGGPMAQGTDTAGLESMTRGVSQQLYASYGGHLASRSVAFSREPDRFPEPPPLRRTAAAGVPMNALDGTRNQPSAPPVQGDTDSNRAPALAELADFSGFDGFSVVPEQSGQAQSMNGQGDTNDDYARPPAGFPVAGAQSSRNNPKESSVTDHAQCPTCGGLGRVAVRKQAYSGLPQVDQIVNADETKSETSLPTDVAFPLVGWDPNNVNRAISETEQRMPSHAQPTMLKRTKLQYEGAGDDSGWLGDDGAKGPDYPGYSAPVYDGSSNLGQPDPVYGFGGDQAPGPRMPYGKDEAADFSNNPGETYDPTVPHNNDGGFREVSQGESTGGMGQATGSVQDAYIVTAQAEIARQQRLIATRAAMLARQG